LNTIRIPIFTNQFFNCFYIYFTLMIFSLNGYLDFVHTSIKFHQYINLSWNTSIFNHRRLNHNGTLRRKASLH